MVIRRQVSAEEATAFARRNGIDYFETSAFSPENTRSVFEALAEKIHLKIEDHTIDPRSEIGVSVPFGMEEFERKKSAGANSRSARNQPERKKDGCC